MPWHLGELPDKLKDPDTVRIRFSNARSRTNAHNARLTTRHRGGSGLQGVGCLTRGERANQNNYHVNYEHGQEQALWE